MDLNSTYICNIGVIRFVGIRDRTNALNKVREPALAFSANDGAVLCRRSIYLL